jgi:hypothetical protein
MPCSADGFLVLFLKIMHFLFFAESPHDSPDSAPTSRDLFVQEVFRRSLVRGDGTGAGGSPRIARMCTFEGSGEEREYGGKGAPTPSPFFL